MKQATENRIEAARDAAHARRWESFARDMMADYRRVSAETDKLLAECKSLLGEEN